MNIESLVEKVQEYLTEDKLSLLRDAFDFAQEAHKGQLRLTGDPFITHPFETAMIVADLHLDEVSLAAALLHDVPEDCGVPFDEIQERFGPDISRLVEGMTRLDKISFQVQGGEIRLGSVADAQVESLRKMFVVTAEDIRVVLIKLADRLHNMRTLKPLAPEKQQRISRETMEIYAPLAHRLGIWQIKWELEDLSFKYLDPDSYHDLAGRLESHRKAREAFVQRAMDDLAQELEAAGVKAELSGRPKHIFSIHRKMERKHAEFGEIYDIHALRVLVNDVRDCYEIGRASGRERV